MDKMNFLEISGILFWICIGNVFGKYLYEVLLKDLWRKFKKWIED